MPRVTNRKITYKGKDGARLKCSIRSDSSGGCRYVRASGTRPDKPEQFFSVDVCVDCGTVYFKNHPGFRVESSEADLLRLTLFQIQNRLDKEDGANSVFFAREDVRKIIKKALNQKRKRS